MFYDLKVEMVDTARPYEWNFAIYAMRVDEKNETRKVNIVPEDDRALLIFVSYGCVGASAFS